MNLNNIWVFAFWNEWQKNIDLFHDILIFFDVPVCVCVCVCGHVYVVYEDTNLYNDMVWHRYYKEKVIYEDIFSVPII